MRAKQKEPVGLTLSVTIHTAPRTPAWSAIWQRLLAPLPVEPSREAPTSAPADVVSSAAREEVEAR